MPEADYLEMLMAAVAKSRKYRCVSPGVIRQIGENELAKRRPLKEAIKATKNKLHQIAGAYFESPMDYDQALTDLHRAIGNAGEFREISRNLMRMHVSTQERLPILETFYRATLASIPPVNTVLDIACGLNPLAFPWMPFGENVVYYAYDIYTDLAAFLGKYFSLMGIQGEAAACDATQSPPTQRADLALLLKTLPCLEQLQPGAGGHLLHAVRADYVLVSFPAHTIGGRRKGMAANYGAQFEAMIADMSWDVQRFEFATELAFLVHKT